MFVPCSSNLNSQMLKHMLQTLDVIGDALVLVAFAVHFRVYRRGTYFPIKRILESNSDTELRHELRLWCKGKEHEGQSRPILPCSFLWAP